MPAVRARTGPFFFPFTTVIGIWISGPSDPAGIFIKRISGPSDPAGMFIKPDFISPDEDVTPPTFNVFWQSAGFAMRRDRLNIVTSGTIFLGIMFLLPLILWLISVFSRSKETS
jgi:hypothetical protein